MDLHLAETLDIATYPSLNRNLSQPKVQAPI